jgi:hypothetical protein
MLELHYFDNLPTAAVITRAERLRSFLAKRIARGAFQFDTHDGGRTDDDEKVILIGHSTGGLDIRRLLYDLEQLKDNGESIPVDGDEVMVQPEHVLRLISGVVFISVPQYGTNLADWVISHPLERQFAAMLAASTASLASQGGPWRIMDWLNDAGAKALDLLCAGIGAVPQSVKAYQAFGTFASKLGAFAGFLSTKVLPHSSIARLGVPVLGDNLKYAVEDAIRESSQQFTDGDPIKESKAREAASELQLWLDNINEDFGAIRDLRNYKRVDDSSRSPSPAHFSEDQREVETESWQRHGIATLSYATLGNRPYPFGQGTPYSGEEAPIWNPFDPFDQYKLNVQGFDSTYLAGYLATAGRGFDINTGQLRLKDIRGDSLPVHQYIERWDSDGIVNTASMLWPNGKNTRLVNGDHGDIIGHYRLVPTEEQGSPARRYRRYDFFVSAGEGDVNKFGDLQFEQVWNGIFGFCLNPRG